MNFNMLNELARWFLLLGSFFFAFMIETSPDLRMYVNVSGEFILLASIMYFTAFPNDH
jgi:hypothetical protein